MNKILQLVSPLAGKFGEFSGLSLDLQRVLMKRLAVLLVTALWMWIPLHGQVTLRNASFEGESRDATVPVGWFPCEAGTTPDIMSGNGKVWSVRVEPAEGDTYVGLITREDGTFESIGQRLSGPLQPRECYQFTLQLAHSPTYATFNGPLKLRIWGGSSKCARDQLLLETPFISEAEWQTFEIDVVPKQALHYMLLEAHYREGKFSYRGNILIDAFSPIVKCSRAGRLD